MDKEKIMARNFYLECDEEIRTQFDSLTRIIKNSAKCSKCNQVIESKSRHDYQSCQCGEISVDGGISYLKRSARDFSSLIDLSDIRFYTQHELIVEIKTCESQSNLGGKYYEDRKKSCQELLFLYKQYQALAEKKEIIHDLNLSQDDNKTRKMKV